jgi:phage gp16-like protein
VTRRRLNHKVRALAHGTLGLDEETYRTVVESVTGKRHVTECNDEEANLVLLALRRMKGSRKERSGGGNSNGQQQRFIARLMDHLHWTWQDTAGFCERVVKKKSTRQCDAAELSKIIRGMIAIIDQDVTKGKIQMSHTERFEYEQHVKHYRQKSAVG